VSVSQVGSRRRRNPVSEPPGIPQADEAPPGDPDTGQPDPGPTEDTIDVQNAADPGGEPTPENESSNAETTNA